MDYEFCLPHSFPHLFGDMQNHAFEGEYVHSVLGITNYIVPVW